MNASAGKKHNPLFNTLHWMEAFESFTP